MSKVEASVDHYPLSERQPDRLKTPSGLAFTEIDLDAVLAGKVQMRDLRVTAEALEWQADIAEAAGRRQLAENLRRASELSRVPEERILQIYQMLRPGRASKEALMKSAEELESQWQASRCARFVREAARAYFR
ncbi:MAG: diol dehydratase small subunit [Acidobacteria bacterium]|nr:diol dehydratase small subunit [Acidobacteriota bacterium]MCI0626219.1 diol dehydratase small subunit [Acidobacteriota bacterium]MCI0717630.1 diol dehydratase small subunit [Acidobacteriota bacterium]